MYKITIAAAVAALVFAVCSQEKAAMNNKLTITAGSHTFTATLEDNDAAGDFKALLPMTVKMSDLNRNEKHCELPVKLPATATRPGAVRSGELMLYGSSTIVLFYEAFSSSYRYTRLGRIDNPTGLKAALGTGDVTITFQQPETDTKMPKKTTRRVASDGAVMQTANPAMPTRVLKTGTRINMHFGDAVIPGILNDSETAKALIARLPYTVRVNRYSHDFCGVMKDPLPYREESVHYGWLNGDIDFATDANYFTILFEDEKNSEQYGHQINIGVIDCELSKISRLRGSYDVRIELAR